jgi:hypothetical protein
MNGMKNLKSRINYKRVLPEILLDLGEKTIFNNPESPIKEIIKFHINIENWLGDDLLWNFPETIVTERLKKDFENNVFTGFLFDDILITKDVYFYDNYHLDKPLPKFYWMKINGKENEDDFFIKASELYISERVYNYLKKKYLINNIQIDLQKNEFDDFILSLIAADKKSWMIQTTSNENISYNTTRSNSRYRRKHRI